MSLLDDWDTEDGVCPGCFACTGEPCAEGCSEEIVRRRLEESADDEAELDSALDAHLDDADDQELAGMDFTPVWPPTDEGVAELLFGPRTGGQDCGDDEGEDTVPVSEAERVEPLQEAAAELALCTRRLEASTERLYASLLPKERALLHSRDRVLRPRWEGDNAMQRQVRERRQRELPEGARSCRWCHELVLDDAHGAGDADHDFCEPDEPTVQTARPVIARPPLPPPMPEPGYRSQTLCPNCQRWHTIDLARPEHAVALGMVSSTCIHCPCGVAISIAYSWRRSELVGLRYERIKPVERPN